MLCLPNGSAYNIYSNNTIEVENSYLPTEKNVIPMEVAGGLGIRQLMAQLSHHLFCSNADHSSLDVNVKFIALKKSLVTSFQSDGQV